MMLGESLFNNKVEYRSVVLQNEIKYANKYS